MAGTVKDITGNKYGRLTVLGLDSVRDRSSYWLCLCECGNEKIVRNDCLKSGNTQSCGCLNREPREVIHGLARTRLYRIYHAMKQRCYNSNANRYDRYGGRGILICAEWLNDFQTFAEWAISNGYADGLTIDRINNDGNYEPSNCRWVTQRVQMRNTSRNTIIEYNGERRILTDWCELYGVDTATAVQRIARGWGLDRVFKPTE